MHDSPDGSDRFACNVKRDQQAFFGCRNDWQQIGVAPFEVPEEQGTILIEHVAAGAEVAWRPASDVWIPHACDSRPIEPLALKVRRLAIPRQLAKASGVSLGNLQDRVGQSLKNRVRRVG